MRLLFPNRRHVIVGAGAVTLCGIARDGFAAAADWETISPQEAGFDPDLGTRLDKAARTDLAPNLHEIGRASCRERVLRLV